jgi:hypothetical protein
MQRSEIRDSVAAAIFAADCAALHPACEISG